VCAAHDEVHVSLKYKLIVGSLMCNCCSCTMQVPTNYGGALYVAYGSSVVFEQDANFTMESTSISGSANSAYVSADAAYNQLLPFPLYS
jgi:hypothetical protein